MTVFYCVVGGPADLPTQLAANGQSPRRPTAGLRARKPQDSGGENLRELSSCFLAIQDDVESVVTMGVLKRTGQAQEGTDTEGNCPQYVCLSCETAFKVQHHVCPVCESFDVRCSKWVQD
jgi:hypothetical protein